MTVFLRGLQLASALALAPSLVTGQGQQVRIVGEVRSADGAAIRSAEIRANGAPATIRSDSAGRFALEGLPAGQVRVQARALGFAPFDTSFTARAGEALTVVLQLNAVAQQLAPVVTEAVLPYGKPLRYQHTGRFDAFYERRAKKPGTFFTREEIESSGRNTVLDLMSSVPGVRVNFRPGDGLMYLRFARCEGNSIWNQKRPPEERQLWFALFINGQRMTGGAIGMETLAQLKTDEVETVEVYRGTSELPLEAMGNACAAVFVTTRYTTGSVLPKK